MYRPYALKKKIVPCHHLHHLHRQIFQFLADRKEDILEQWQTVQFKVIKQEPYSSKISPNVYMYHSLSAPPPPCHTHTHFLLRTFQVHYHIIFTRTWEVFFTNPITAGTTVGLIFLSFFFSAIHGSLLSVRLQSVVQFEFPV